ncbi:TadE/TadG family type IV pilus assembly protein [Falsiroseomonas sp. E2-1-a20]|uniref:TadE/TadG family type IV pilus assembly protein n=1 Tax=Falsiroseomonas sp. E2-1-a20 TaxID=3239300 RepID=UPI003F3F8265
MIRLGRRGVASLEFALVGPVLVLLLVGGMEAGRYMATVESLRMASAEAVRAVTLRGGSNIGSGLAACTGLSGAQAGQAQIGEAARLPLLDPAKLEVTLSDCAMDGAVARVTVALRYPHAASLPWFAVTLGETAQAVFN